MRKAIVTLLLFGLATGKTGLLHAKPKPRDCQAAVLLTTAAGIYQELSLELQTNSPLQRLEIAGLKALQRWKAEKRFPPEMGGVSIRWKMEWEQLSPQLLDLSDGRIREEVDIACLSPVVALEWNHGNYFFRFRHGELNWVASELNKALGLEAVPRVQLAKYGCLLGSVSDEVVGTPMDELTGYAFDFNDLKNLVQRGRLKSALLSEAEGFQFLVGNVDGRAGNFILTPSGNLVCFDYDNAFSTGFSWLSSHRQYLGHLPPLLYTRRFLKGLNQLTDSRLQELTQFLPPGTRRQIAFRRDLLIEDAKLRGEAAILPDEMGTVFPLER